HSMEDMAMYCDRVVVMSGAKLLLNGTTKEVFGKSEILKENGLDVPEITNIVLKLREKGIEIPGDIYTVEDAVKSISALYLKKEVKNGI
ncbi:MAG: energy-coupling factor transporter ATPase, partial [Clostridia bacterium]|nr:energy-coupling factor transporter ATPase [Clostridia bacterium]